MPGGVTTISVIGAGRIGREVIDYITDTPGLSLGRVLTKSGVPDTGDADVFFGTPADLIIETAGPAALRAYGARVLAMCDLWTVGAVPLAETAFREQLETIARRSETNIHLFSPWFSGIGIGGLGPADLEIHAQRPGIGEVWSGGLAEAVARFPNDLNSAVAAALCGPGIEATRVRMSDSGDGGPHRIDTVLRAPAGEFRSTVTFEPDKGGPHPTAAAIVGRLAELGGVFRYG